MNLVQIKPTETPPRLARTSFVAAIAFLLASCGFNSAPECSDSDVIDILRDLSRESLWPVLGPHVVQNDPDAWSTDVPYLIAMDRNRLEDAAKADPKANRMLQAMDRQFDAFGLTFSGIRTNDQNHEIRKSWCGAQFSMTINRQMFTDQIEYIAQFTNDGLLYVEMKN